MATFPRTIVGLAVVAAVFAACGPSTSLTAVWHTPDPIGPRFQKILMVAQIPNEGQRRTVETALVRNIPKGVASYRVLGNIDVKDSAQARAKVASEGFDGAVIVRLVGTDRQTTYTPGSAYWGAAPYATVWGYWGYGWGGVYEPGYLQTEHVITLESNVYALATEKLLWSSRTDTVDPVSVDALVDSMVKATVHEMKKRKVL